MGIILCFGVLCLDIFVFDFFDIYIDACLMYVCLPVRLYPINVKTAEPIGP